MINSSEVAKQCNVSGPTIKNLIDDLFGLENVHRTKPKTGNIILTREQVSKIYEQRGLIFERKIATIGNQKGGVGKSLLTINAAKKKVNEGAKVCIIDLDPEACATNFLLKEEDYGKEYKTMLDVFRDNLNFKDAIIETKYEGLYIVPCNGKARRAERFVQNENLGTLMRRKLEGMEDFDLILFEIPPTFSNIIESAYIASDIVIMPTFPDSWSIESCILTDEDIKESVKKWEVKAPEIKVLLNKYSEKRNASKDSWSTLIQYFGDKVLPLKIKDTAELQNSINDGNSIFDPGVRASKALKEDFSELANYICPLKQANPEARQ